ncbi:unnamed protein product [Ascophyllum nodosum]
MSGNEPTHVHFQTSVGSFTVELYYNHAPRTCHNLRELAKRGYYDNTIFHRVIKDFMVQGGDPTGTGRGGESCYGGKFEDEIRRDLKHTGAGVVSMANAGPNTNAPVEPAASVHHPLSAQFFITLGPTPWLDGKHTIFGRVSAGMKVVRRMGMVAVNTEDKPQQDIRILHAKPLVLALGEDGPAEP